LKKKEASGKNQPSSATVAAVEKSTQEAEEDFSSTVASVSQDHQIIVRDSQVLDVCELNGIPCKLFASVDSGSPISFICKSVYEKFYDPSVTPLKVSSNLYRAIDQGVIKSPGFVSSSIRLKVLSSSLLYSNFHVLNHNCSPTHILLGRDCLRVNKLFYGMDFTKKGSSKETLELLSHVASADVIDQKANVLDSFSDINIDFDSEVKKKLLNLLQKVEDPPVPVIEDDYLVKINLKDDSTFAYAPRKFAWPERIQIREITDDLLERGIIKYSTSPYCSRVVPVRKKNGSLRLCVDLRPLNSRVVKQKYPFPLIEDCLARLSSKTVFTLLDLKDGFHHIKIHPDFTKYFAFATPDGQFEYLRLPFGFCEAPAEFQRRIVQILRPLIREDNVIVYIDDILIPSTSIEENLDTLEKFFCCLNDTNFR